MYDLHVKICRLIILPGVKLDLTLQKDISYRMLKNTFGPKEEEEEVRTDMRKLHEEEFHDLYSIPNITWVIK
jgi:hypothetical protein